MSTFLDNVNLPPPATFLLTFDVCLLSNFISTNICLHNFISQFVHIELNSTEYPIVDAAQVLNNLENATILLTLAFFYKKKKKKEKVENRRAKKNGDGMFTLAIVPSSSSFFLPSTHALVVVFIFTLSSSSYSVVDCVVRYFVLSVHVYPIHLVCIQQEDFVPSEERTDGL